MARKKSPRAAATVPAADEAPKKETGFASSYVEFARTLRTWFVAYGIGVPVLVLTQTPLRDAVLVSEDGRRLAWFFLGGIALQIAQALTYKVAMWYLYMGELDPRFCNTRRYRASDAVSMALWLELVFDLGTVVLFTLATLRILSLITEVPTPVP